MATYRALVFAYATADAELRVHIGSLESHLNFNPTARFGSDIPKFSLIEGNGAAGVVNDVDKLFPPLLGDFDIVVTGGESARCQTVSFKFHNSLIRFQNRKDAASNGDEVLSGKYSLRAHRAVFLADDARSVHGPRQTAASVNKRRSQPDGT